MLQEMYEKTGEKPQALLDRPVLSPLARFYYENFVEMSTDRGYSDIGPLALSTFAIETYRQCFEIEEKEDFHMYIKKIDSYWLAKIREKREATLKKSK